MRQMIRLVCLPVTKNLDKFQTQFTQKEIDEMKVKFGVTFSDFEQIPVEEDEE